MINMERIEIFEDNNAKRIFNGIIPEEENQLLLNLKYEHYILKYNLIKCLIKSL
jgi:hypothetical protein